MAWNILNRLDAFGTRPNLTACVKVVFDTTATLPLRTYLLALLQRGCLNNNIVPGRIV